jgi:hypothetical protein
VTKPTLCIKKKLNCALYQAHLRAAKEWGKTCYVIKNYINRSLNEELERKYKTMCEKLKEVPNIQIDKPDNIENFYPCVINKIDIVFYTPEISLFDKGLK